jgi:hypothetical protein
MSNPTVRQTTIINLGAAPPSAQNQGAVGPQSAGVPRELHPLKKVNITEEDVQNPEAIARHLNELHESFRRATLSMRQDPKSAPCYVRGVVFARPANANVAAPYTATVSVRHSLGRPVSGCHACMSQGGAYSGFVVPNPPGLSNSQYVTVQHVVPAGSGPLTHDLHLFAD